LADSERWRCCAWRKATSFSRTSQRKVQVWPGLRALINARNSIASIATSVTSNLDTLPSHNGLSRTIS
jgi:hypothetical protein